MTDGGPRFELATVDIAITVVYFVGVIAHGLWESRGKESADDYFLAGRRLPWYLVGVSLFASNMSGASFVGLMGASYEYGLPVFNYEWTATLVLVFFALFMLPHFLRLGLYTIPEYLETRYDRKCRLAFSLFTVIAVVFVDTAGGLYAGGTVVTTVFDIPLWQAVAGLAALAGVYTILGGLSAVVVTDTVQAILLMLGAAVICAVGLHEVGGWDAMVRKLSAIGGDRMSLMQPLGDDFLPWPGLGGVVLLGFYYWALNQFVVQRTLGSENLDQGRKGALFAGFLKLPNLLLMIVPGAFAILLYPDLNNPDVAFPALAFDLLPIGARGLILTALVAAIMSSLDSALNAGSTILTMDFVRAWQPDIPHQKLVALGRALTGVLTVLAAAWAPLIRRFETLFEYFQSALSYVTPPLVAVFLLGIFWKRLNAKGAFATLVAAVAVGAPLFVVKEVTGLWAEWGLPQLHFTYMGMLSFAGGTLLLAGISYLTEPPDPAAVEETTFDPATFVRQFRRKEGSSWLGDFRWQAAGLMSLTGLLVAAFW